MKGLKGWVNFTVDIYLFIKDLLALFRHILTAFWSFLACGEVKSESHGTIMTPGFPLTYPREGECLWLISVQDHLYLRLEFVAFELEFNTQLCMDEIFIWDGKTASSRLLLR